MYTVRLITLIILLFFASLNTIVFAGLTYDNESHNTSKFTVAMGNFFSRLLMVWDQKVVNSVRVAVGPVSHGLCVSID
ncbi:hypothetical protein F2Q69_00032657 [Brassica cretica]|uniref:Uncharacterized protein n=1 Tax=Brassica cretica TaxID=69181 RepID=A0A8S9SRC2_BRACR|nr:hypothetical protein F2Q69_00032657 [Brassica cretica]